MNKKDNPHYDKEPPNFRYLKHKKYCGNCANIGDLPNCMGQYCKKYILKASVHSYSNNTAVCDDWEKKKDE